jgi:hypothetical protein
MDDAQTAALLRSILERIRTQADAGLASLNHARQIRAIQWRCAGCGHRKHFTKPVGVDATIGSPCPKCHGTSYEPVTPS